MYSKGISWIDDCRIPFVDGDGLLEHQVKYGVNSDYGKDSNTKFGQIKNSVICGSPQGRFPANLLVSDDMLNDGSVSSIKQNKDYIPPNEANSIHNYSRGKYSGIQDKGTNSRYYDIDKWFDKIIE